MYWSFVPFWRGGGGGGWGVRKSFSGTDPQLSPSLLNLLLDRAILVFNLISKTSCSQNPYSSDKNFKKYSAEISFVLPWLHPVSLPSANSLKDLLQSVLKLSRRPGFPIHQLPKKLDRLKFNYLAFCQNHHCWRHVDHMTPFPTGE